MRGGFWGMRFWLWKVVVWTAFSHQTSCCLSGTVGFAHVQRMLSNTGIMVEECFPSWKGGSVSKAAFRFGRCVRRRRYGEFPSPHPLTGVCIGFHVGAWRVTSRSDLGSGQGSGSSHTRLQNRPRCSNHLSQAMPYRITLTVRPGFSRLLR